MLHRWCTQVRVNIWMRVIFSEILPEIEAELSLMFPYSFGSDTIFRFVSPFEIRCWYASIWREKKDRKKKKNIQFTSVWNYFRNENNTFIESNWRARKKWVNVDFFWECRMSKQTIHQIEWNGSTWQIYPNL